MQRRARIRGRLRGDVVAETNAQLLDADVLSGIEERQEYCGAVGAQEVRPSADATKNDALVGPLAPGDQGARNTSPALIFRV